VTLVYVYTGVQVELLQGPNVYSAGWHGGGTGSSYQTSYGGGGGGASDIRIAGIH